LARTFRLLSLALVAGGGSSIQDAIRLICARRVTITLPHTRWAIPSSGSGVALCTAACAGLAGAITARHTPVFHSRHDGRALMIALRW